VKGLFRGRAGYGPPLTPTPKAKANVLKDPTLASTNDGGVTIACCRRARFDAPDVPRVNRHLMMRRRSRRLVTTIHCTAFASSISGQWSRSGCVVCAIEDLATDPLFPFPGMTYVVECCLASLVVFRTLGLRQAEVPVLKVIGRRPEAGWLIGVVWDLGASQKSLCLLHFWTS
jgi:hypothetical protein